MVSVREPVVLPRIQVSVENFEAPRIDSLVAGLGLISNSQSNVNVAPLRRLLSQLRENIQDYLDNDVDVCNGLFRVHLAKINKITLMCNYSIFAGLRLSSRTVASEKVGDWELIICRPVNCREVVCFAHLTGTDYPATFGFDISISIARSAKECTRMISEWHKRPFFVEQYHDAALTYCSVGHNHTNVEVICVLKSLGDYGRMLQGTRLF